MEYRHIAAWFCKLLTDIPPPSPLSTSSSSLQGTTTLNPSPLPFVLQTKAHHMNSGRYAAFGCCIGHLPRPAPIEPKHRCRIRATAEEATDTTGKSGVNVIKYKSQRSMISSDRSALKAEEVNDLMIKAGKGVRCRPIDAPWNNFFSTQLRSIPNSHSWFQTNLLVFCFHRFTQFTKSRDIDKWRRALEGSFAVVYARLIADKCLVGFARATSDRALNGTIWDVVTDPSLPDEVRT